MSLSKNIQPIHYMKKILFSCILTGIMQTAYAQNYSLDNTIKVNESDSKEVIIQKAAHVVPTDNQLRALEKEFIAFIHFGPNTFTRMEWGTGMEDPSIFDLKTLDTDQWCKAIKAAGMKLVMLTVKHHDGFCLWQTRYTKHGIMSTGFQDGKGDILRDLSKSCKKYGLKLGVYLSPADLYQIENPEGLYGNGSKKTLRTIPREVEGRPFANKTKFQFVVDDYNEYFMNQLFEILTEYGEVDEVWFDGAHPKQKGGQTYNYKAWQQVIRTLAPHAAIFGKEDIRWCGNEAGRTRRTEWNVIGYQENPDTMNMFPDMVAEDLGSREALQKAKYLHYQQAEINTSIREGWFYRDDTEQKVRNADDVFDIYERAVGGNSTFLLNIPPNREGLLPQKDVEVLEEVGRRIRETYGTDLLKKAKGPKEVLDKDRKTYTLIDEKDPVITITTRKPITLNRLTIQEAIEQTGERVEEHYVEAWIDGAWKKIAESTNIGYKRILRFPQITTDRIRIHFPKMRMQAGICKVSAHYYPAVPPQLTAKRSLDGQVTIQVKESDFGWKRHGENSAGNLNAGYSIYYTTDGTAPTKNSESYQGAFTADNQEVQAVSVLNGKTGPVLQERFGYIKKDWKAEASSEAEQHSAALAADENPNTFWLSGNGDQDRTLTIDLGAVKTIRGFAYTPQNRNAEGMIERGTVWVSQDKQNWKKVEDFMFGNLINDPTKRSCTFKNTTEARYFKIQMTEGANRSEKAAVAEVDIF